MRTILLFVLAGQCVAQSGIIQVLTNGQYCSNYYSGGSLAVNYRHTSNCKIDPAYNCKNPGCSTYCTPKGGNYPFAGGNINVCCPWNENYGCSISYPMYWTENGDEPFSVIGCSAGCVTASNCIGLPSNADWSGTGTSATDCPWTCNAGYRAEGNSCVFHACQVCNPGYFNTGCNSTFPGSCKLCTN